MNRYYVKKFYSRSYSWRNKKKILKQLQTDTHFALILIRFVIKKNLPEVSKLNFIVLDILKNKKKKNIFLLWGGGEIDLTTYAIAIFDDVAKRYE